MCLNIYISQMVYLLRCENMLRRKWKTSQGCTGGTTAAAEVIVAAAWKTGALTATAPLAGDGECPGSSHSSTQEDLLTPGA